MEKIYVVKITKLYDGVASTIIGGVFNTEDLAKEVFENTVTTSVKESPYGIMMKCDDPDSFMNNDKDYFYVTDNKDQLSVSLDELNNEDELEGYMKALRLHPSDILKGGLTL